MIGSRAEAGLMFPTELPELEGGCTLDRYWAREDAPSSPTLLVSRDRVCSVRLFSSA